MLNKVRCKIRCWNVLIVGQFVLSNPSVKCFNRWLRWFSWNINVKRQRKGLKSSKIKIIKCMNTKSYSSIWERSVRLMVKSMFALRIAHKLGLAKRWLNFSQSKSLKSISNNHANKLSSNASKTAINSWKDASSKTIHASKFSKTEWQNLKNQTGSKKLSTISSRSSSSNLKGEGLEFLLLLWAQSIENSTESEKGGKRMVRI